MTSIVVAMTPYQQERYNKIDNLWTRIRYGVSKGLFFFTSWGEENCCSEYPDKVVVMEPGDRIDCDDFCSYDKCAMDTWYDDTAYLSGQPNCDSIQDRIDVYDGEISGVGASFTAIAFGNTQLCWITEVYCCPQTCELPTDYETETYVCEDGDWDYKGKFDKDEFCSWDESGLDECWCGDENENFYVDMDGGIHCVEDDYSRVNDGTWCAACSSHDEKRCYSNDVYWFDSCGGREEQFDECGAFGCENGVCRTEEPPTNGEGTCSETGGECILLSCPLEYENLGKLDCSLGKTCCKLKSTIFWESTIALDINELIDSTSTQMLNALCKGGGNCPSDSTCKIIERLVAQNYATESQMNFVRRDYCDQKTTWEKYFVDIDESCAFEWQKNTYFRNNYGLCVVEEETEIMEFIRKIGRGIPITGDPLTDGIIVLIGGLLLFVIIFSRVAGCYGRFEYEI